MARRRHRRGVHLALASGPVGGLLVGEVLVGIVDADGESYRIVDPGWRPTLPAAQAGRFGLADLAFSADVARAEA